MKQRHVHGIAVLAAVGCLAAAVSRPAKQIGADLGQVSGELAKLHYADAVKYNPLYREQMGREYGPLYDQERTLLTEYAVAVPKAATALRHLAMVDDARLAFWGVAGATERLDAAAGDADPSVAADAAVCKPLVAWWQAYGDAEAQRKVVADVERMVAATPTNGSLADVVHLMVTINPATVAIGQRLTTDLTVKLAKTPIGKAYAAVPNKVDEPLAFDGTTVAGKPFKSSAWAGKVVLVDFWATWCPPCREGLPEVVKTYQQFHDQGLEIVGVSSDNDKQALAAFLKEHPEMAWPQLFASGKGWHPLTKKFGIGSIPTMYLIDRNGTLRTVEAREEMRKLIPTLLAEPYVPAAKATIVKPTARPIGR